MMLLDTEGNWLNKLQRDGAATCSITASDDLGIVCDRLRALANQLGIEVRIFVTDTSTLYVDARRGG